MHSFKKDDLVIFGRPDGEQTQGRVIRVNKVSLTIEQTEDRSEDYVRKAGAKWRVSPSFVRHASPAASVPKVETKRSEADLIAALQRIEVSLSPENLHCDGERSRAEARKVAARLNAERKVLVAELGREPTSRELWG